MKIVLLNTVLANGGDAAIAEAEADLFASLYSANIDLVVLDSLPSHVQHRYPHWRLLPDPYQLFGEVKVVWVAWLVRFGLWRLAGPHRVAQRYAPARGATRIIWELATADHVVATGGTWLVPGYPLVDRLFTLLFAWSLRQPVVYMPQTCGPFVRQRFWWRFVLRRAELCMVRDDGSRQYLRELGVPAAKISITPDVVWRRPPMIPLAPAASRPLRMLVALRDWQIFPFDESVAAGRERYLHAVADALTAICREREVDLVWCSTVQGTPGYWRDDAQIAEYVTALLPEELRQRSTINYEYYSPQQFQQVARGCDLVITSRMHVAILAWQAGVPVLPIVNERKMDLLLMQFGIAEYALHVHTVTGASLTHSLRGVLADLNDYRAKTRLAAAKLHRAATGIERQLRDCWRLPREKTTVARRGKVLVVVPRYPKTSETFVAIDLQPLQQKGWSVAMVARRPDSHDARPTVAVTYTDLHSPEVTDDIEARLQDELALLPQVTRAVLTEYWDDRSLRVLAVVIQRDRPQVLYCHFGITGLAVSVVCQALRVSIPIVTAFHGYDFSLLVRQGGYTLYDHLAAAGAHCAVPSYYARRRLLRLGFAADRISAVRYGCDLTTCTFQPRLAPLTDAINLVSVGRLAAKKGFDDALHAVARLLVTYPNLRYTVLGGGEEESALRQSAATLGITHAVRWLGERPHADAIALLQSADILVVPSTTAPNGSEEGMPLVLIEGMATGVPVVTTDHAGIPELVTPAVGWIARQGDAVDLTRAIRACIAASPRRRQVITQAARRAVCEQGRTLDAHVDRLDLLLSRV